MIDNNQLKIEIPNKDSIDVLEDEHYSTKDNMKILKQNKSSRVEKKLTNRQTENENSVSYLKETDHKVQEEDDKCEGTSEEDYKWEDTLEEDYKCEEASEDSIDSKTTGERFNRLNSNEKQIIVDNTVDQIILKNQRKHKYNYQNYEKCLRPKGYQIPTDEKLYHENTKEQDINRVHWDKQWSFQNITYRPQILREKLQLSIWKVDTYGVSKLQFIYFSPKNQRMMSEDARNFRLQSSLDNKTVCIVEHESLFKEYDDILILLI